MQDAEHKLFSNRKSLEPEEAHKLLGTNFFGSREWIKFFGTKFRPEHIPEIPWNEADLKNPGIDQNHFLFLGLDSLDGKPLNLSAWSQLFPMGNQPNLHPDWFLNHRFAQTTCGLRWYLMPIGILKHSNNLSYNEQKNLLPPEYEIPTAITRVTANILYYLHNNKYLDTDYWARTSDRADSGGRVYVRGVDDLGLAIYSWNDSAIDYVGISASRKIMADIAG